MINNSADVAWQDSSVYFEGVPIGKIRGWKFKPSQETDEVYAAGSDPLYISTGNRSYSGELKVLNGALINMNAAAVAAGFKDIRGVSVTVVVNLKATAGTPMKTYTLVGAVIGEYEIGMEQNAKMLEVTLPFKFLDIVDV